VSSRRSGRSRQVPRRVWSRNGERLTDGRPSHAGASLKERTNAVWTGPVALSELFIRASADGDNRPRQARCRRSRSGPYRQPTTACADYRCMEPAAVPLSLTGVLRISVQSTTFNHCLGSFGLARCALDLKKLPSRPEFNFPGVPNSSLVV